MTKAELIQQLEGFTDHTLIAIYNPGAGGLAEIEHVEVIDEMHPHNDLGAPVICLYIQE